MASPGALSREASPNYLGACLIIANDYKTPGYKYTPLPGTQEDLRQYEKTFSKLQFKVTPMYNLTKGEMMSAIDELRRSPLKERYIKYVLLIYCGHGEEGIIVGQDGGKLEVDVIVNRFVPQENGDCMISVTKLFFFDACRGNEEDKGVYTARGAEKMSWTPKVAQGQDFFVAFATTPMHKAYEINCSKGEGTGGLWSKFVNEELNNEDNLHRSLNDIFTMVNKKMEEFSRSMFANFQVSQSVSSLKNIVYLIEEARCLQQTKGTPQPVPAPRTRIQRERQQQQHQQQGQGQQYHGRQQQGHGQSSWTQPVMMQDGQTFGVPQLQQQQQQLQQQGIVPTLPSLPVLGTSSSSWEVLNSFLNSRAVKPSQNVVNEPGNSSFIYEISFFLDHQAFRGKSVRLRQESDARENASLQVIQSLTKNGYDVHSYFLPSNVGVMKTRSRAAETDTTEMVEVSGLHWNQPHSSPVCGNSANQISRSYPSPSQLPMPAASPLSTTVKVDAVDYLTLLKTICKGKPFVKTTKEQNLWKAKLVVPGGIMVETSELSTSEKESKQLAAKMAYEKLMQK